MTDPIAGLNAALGDRYVVDRELGRGGMALVYLARDLKHERFVALKTLRPEIAVAVGRERFLREIKLAARLQHPNILSVYDSGDAAGTLYYVMPFVEGESLRNRLVREPQLPLDDALQIAREVADALAYAHGHDVVHRDIKPENIMMSGGHAIVADFGIARAVSAAGGDKLTETGLAIGTPAYMSPEQASGTGQVDRRSDIYSLACVLYETLAGQPPFTGPTAQAIMARHSLDAVPRLKIVRETIPDALEDVINRALAKVPADRYQTAAQFAAAITAASTGTVSRVKPRESTSGGFPWRMRKPVVVAVVPVVALLAVGVWLVWGGGRRAGGAVSGGGGLDPRRVAVLYFQDLGRDTGLAYLSDGLTEAVIERLERVRALDVLSKNATSQFRASAIPRDSVARLLNVGTIVDGSIEPLGERLRLTVRLVDGLSGADIRRGTFELSRGSELALRDSAVEEVTRFLRERLGEEIRLRERRAGTDNGTAWALAQRAEKLRKNAELLLRQDSLAAAIRDLQAADSLLAEAEQHDPAWDDPPVQRAIIAHRRARLAGGALAAAPFLDAGLEHTAGLLARDPRNARALEQRGTLRYRRYIMRLEPDPAKALVLLEQAERDLRAAVDADPTLASAWSTLSALAYQKSEFVEAKLAAQRAYEEDAYLSLADQILWRLFTTSYDLEQFVEAIHWCDEGRRRFERDPRFTECRLWTMTLSGVTPDVPAAWALLERLAELTPQRDWPLTQRRAQMALAGVLARAGLADSARRVAVAARGTPAIDTRGSLLSFEAFVRTLLGDRDEAIELLKRYLTANPEDRAGMAKDYTWWWRNLRSDPRFLALSGEAR